VFPTATLPAQLPDVLIVSSTPQPSGVTSDRYVVQTGDTLSSIADRFGVTVDDIINANNITDPTGLHAGDELIIPSGEATPEPQEEPTAAPTTALQEEEPTAVPTSGSTGGTTYTVQDGDNPASIAAQFGITAEELMDANGITDPTSLLVGQVLTIPGQ
jgi:LysM repeat protein